MDDGYGTAKMSPGPCPLIHRLPMFAMPPMSAMPPRHLSLMCPCLYIMDKRLNNGQTDNIVNK